MPVAIAFPTLSVPVMIKAFIHPINDTDLLREVIHEAVSPFTTIEILLL